MDIVALSIYNIEKFAFSLIIFISGVFVAGRSLNVIEKIEMKKRKFSDMPYLTTSIQFQCSHYIRRL